MIKVVMMTLQWTTSSSTDRYSTFSSLEKQLSRLVCVCVCVHVHVRVSLQHPYHGTIFECKYLLLCELLVFPKCECVHILCRVDHFILQFASSAMTKMVVSHYVQAVRRLGGVKSQSASDRWKKKQKKEEQPTEVRVQSSGSTGDFSFSLICCTDAVKRRGQTVTGKTDRTSRPTGCHRRLRYPIYHSL